MSHFLKTLFILERVEGKEKERETPMWERNIDLSYMCLPWTEPTTQACAETGKWTRNLLLCGMTPNQLSHTSQGSLIYIKKEFL